MCIYIYIYSFRPAEQGTASGSVDLVAGRRAVPGPGVVQSYNKGNKGNTSNSNSISNKGNKGNSNSNSNSNRYLYNYYYYQ